MSDGLRSRGLEPALLLACMALATPATAQTDPGDTLDCGIALERDPTPPNFLYDPFDVLLPIEPVVFDFAGEEGTELLLTFQTEGGVDLPVLLGQSGVTLSIGVGENNNLTPTTSGSVELVIGSDGTKLLSVDFLLDNDVVAPPGSYTERIFVRIENRTTGVICQDRPRFDVRMEVPPRAQVNIAGVDGDFNRSLKISTIDFGSLETGESRRVFVQVRSNSDVDLSISSENGGAMVLDNSDIEARVPYATLLGDQTISFESAYRAQLSAAADYRGRSVPLEFQILDIPGVPSGAYSDLITIEVSAF